MNNGKIIVGCERSQVVCQAFRRRGFDAYSCDVLPTKWDPAYHFQCDIKDLAGETWLLAILFPPCNALARSGTRYFAKKRADGSQQAAIEFFMWCSKFPALYRALENPMGIMSTEYRKPDQYIQPYTFGEDASKKTGLWLYDLPRLWPTKYNWGKRDGKRIRWANQTASGNNNLAPSPDRAEVRAITYNGIAEAMALQWGSYIKYFPAIDVMGSHPPTIGYIPLHGKPLQHVKTSQLKIF
jgi:hypothetical protein